MTHLTDRHAIFETWAPAAGPWSPWTKPVLFAALPRPLPALASTIPPSLPWRERIGNDCAVVIDLPGAASVETGLALVPFGFWPVPLFNACPAPAEDVAAGAICAVDVDSILATLVAGTSRLAEAGAVAQRAPVFLLDSHRGAPTRPIQPEMFDNRSVVFASDFPSAAMLRSHGIRRTLIVHDSALPIGRDLLYALSHWRKDGIEISAGSETGAPMELAWPADNFWGGVRQRMFALFSLKRNSGGGFGGFVPEASGG